MKENICVYVYVILNIHIYYIQRLYNKILYIYLDRPINLSVYLILTLYIGEPYLNYKSKAKKKKARIWLILNLTSQHQITSNYFGS